MKQLTAFQRDVLYVIGKDQSPHGLAIKEKLESYYRSEVNHGRLYPNLDQLADKGLIDKGKKDDRTNVYELTDEARNIIRQRHQWEDVNQFV